MGINNITVFSDASFCSDSKAGGGAFWARGDDHKTQDAFPLTGALQSHDAEVMAACQAVLHIADHPELGKELVKGKSTRVVLVVDCLTVKHVLTEAHSVNLSPAARKLVNEVLQLQKRLKFFLKVNHVKGHSGTASARQWVNNWCDRSSREKMRELRDGPAARQAEEEKPNELIVEVDEGGTVVQVFKDKNGVYQVHCDGVVRHPDCSAEDAMRALGAYLQSALYKVAKATAQPGTDG